jgi:hypothetical protein
VGTTRHNGGGAATAEAIVNDLKNRLAMVEWRDLPARLRSRPPGSYPDRTYTSWRNANVHVGHVISITSLPLYCRGGQVMNVLERLVGAAAQPGLMAGLAWHGRIALERNQADEFWGGQPSNHRAVSSERRE